MIKQFFLYQIPKPAPGAFDDFLGGLYLIKGVPLFLQLGVLVLYPLALSILLISAKKTDPKKQSHWLRISQLCSLIAFSLNALLVFTPWDESFINLRHSFNLSKYNIFSFNLATPSEGTVDFLVFAFLGLLGKLHLPLFELLLFQSWLGGILCIWAIKKLTVALEIPGAKEWSVFVSTLFPALILNSSHGFATSLFAAAILWAIYFSFIKRNIYLSFLLLSIIPLIRWEGFWFLFLCYAFILRDLDWVKKNHRVCIALSILGLIPTFLIANYRLHHFKSWIPTPVIYKSSIGNPFYLMLGIRNFFLDLISTFSFPFVIVWFSVLFLDKSIFQKIKNLLPPLLVLILFTIPYYLSGGDWFPPSWGRYFFPISLFLLVSSWKLLTSLSTKLQKPIIVSFVFAACICAAAPTSSFIRIYELMFSHGSALLSLNLKKRTENPTYRPHYLSQLALHLNKTTESNDRIGTSELATLMFFSGRDAVDFLGLTDLQLAQLPIRETPLFLRKNPKAAELPLLIFKRVAPERLSKFQPEYLYLFDFMIEILMDQKSTEGWSDKEFFRALRRWELKFKGLVDPLYGGLTNILALGYIPFVITYDNDFCALYFVRKDKLHQHQIKLTEIGLTGRLVIKTEDNS